MPSDFDLDDTFLSEGDASTAAEAAPEVSEAARGQLHALAARTAPEPPANIEDVATPSGAFSIADLLETGVPLDWQEAVSIARRMCEAIARHPGAGTHEYHLDPRQIAITEKGTVVVAPGEPGTDPFVKQIGRILRALLEGGDAPAQLRLLVAQAVFDGPGYVSLEEFAEALASFEQEAHGDGVRGAFRRAREMKYSAAPVTGTPVLSTALTAVRARNGDEPAEAPLVTPPARRLPPRHFLAAALATAIGAATPIVFWLSRDNYEVRIPAPQVVVPSTSVIVPSLPDPTVAPQATFTIAPPSPPAVAPPPPAPEARVEAAPTARLTQPPVVAAPPQPVPQPLPQPQRAVTGDVGAIREASPAVVLPALPPAPPPGRGPEEAGGDSSLRTLALAFDHYNRARTALDAGNHEQALFEAGRSKALLDTLDVNAAPGELRNRLNEMVGRADAVRAREEARIYTTADAEVTPPVAVGRQLPSATPPSLAHIRVGTLEMIIGREGQVETLKLRTPLNRFHERMIVSAAKAWRYRPALKDGKPVKFLLISTINLPES